MLVDGFGREVDYLRISLTERCNFRCQYCMPEKPFSWVPREELLSYEELFLFVKEAIDLGVKKVRITGGEPLMREHLDNFIKMISDYSKSVDLAMSTNGYFLKDASKKLVEAGLKRVNVSLDSLKRDIMAKIAQKDVLQNILEGIEEALKCGLKVKINMVPIKNINESEIVDVLEYGKSIGAEVRFIEFMENVCASEKICGLSKDEMLEKISKKYKFSPLEQTNAPAKRYILENGYTFGVIEPHKEDFCKSCNRIRVSASGDIIPCLYFDEAMSMKDALKNKDISKALEIFKTVLANKPEKNRWSDENVSNRAFYHTGG